MSRTRQGTEAERELRSKLEEAGYKVIRAAKSAGGADLVATRYDGVIFIEAKCCKAQRFVPVRAEAARQLRKLPVPASPVVKKQIWIRVKGEPKGIWNIYDVVDGNHLEAAVEPWSQEVTA